MVMSRAQDVLEQAATTAQQFRTFDQDQTDDIVRAVYLRALDRRVELAKMAQEETGIGVWQHKVIKNVIAAQLVYEHIKNQRTVGVIAEDDPAGIVEVAWPVGPILVYIPVTNPTSTTIFKILISMKTRNPLIISPHQAARRCIIAAAETLYEAALDAGAPEHCIQWLNKPSPETLDEIMNDRRLALILATGTNSLVNKAQRSGSPTIGVGPGNVPVYIGATADVPFAVESIIESKLLDNGSICASEQAVVVKLEVADQVIEEFERHGGYFLSPDEIEKVSRIAYDRERRTMSATVVGQPAQRIAESAGIEVPEGTVLLLARLEGVGPDYPLSAEILAPILAFYVEEDFDGSIRRCTEVTGFGGAGHTAVVYSNNDERIEYFSQVINAGRILVNTPSTQGALGGIYNSLDPSFTLSCGSDGGNIMLDNITTRHLLNTHRITQRRPNPRWMRFDKDDYLDQSIPAEEIERQYNQNF